MPRLLEITVQEIALKQLEKLYRPKAKRKKIFAKSEVYTKKQYGGKRADGLLAFKRPIWGTYVVSMEAKSYKTLPAMKPYRDDKLWIKNSLWAGLLICILSGSLFAIYKMDDGFWQFLIPFNVFVLSSFIYGFVTRKSYKHKVVDVVNQVGQYPANEQWLAFSNDSYKEVSATKRKNLEAICKFRGIGIIIVYHKNKVDVLRLPKKKMNLPSKDFLKYYNKEVEIRQQIV